MKKCLTSIVILCLSFVHLIVNSQIPICGTIAPDKDPYTIPYYGNNKFLDEVNQLIMPLKSLKKSASIDDLENEGALFDLPIKIWLYHDDNGTNAALTHAEVSTVIDNINQRLEDDNTDIQLYQKCEISDINSTFYNHNMGGINE